nr:MAG TPA: hypothetical protein [Caudoviricetes sp.]
MRFYNAKGYHGWCPLFYFDKRRSFYGRIR